MSTILDALKRSERERNQSEVPTLTDMPVLDEPTPLKWIAVTLLAVLVIALVTAMLVYAFNQQAATQSPIATNADGGIADELPIVSVISFSSNAEQRFAMINNKLLREGDYVSAGIRVERIQQDHVLIDRRGQSIALKP